MRQCSAYFKLSARELKQLRFLPAPAHMIELASRCALEAGHAGWHAALGQENPKGEHWIRWAETDSRIDVLESCPSQGQERPCLLFSGHDGRHDFD